MRQIFLDTETTGLNAEQGDRMVEIACVEMINRKLTGNNLHFYLNPRRDSHEDAFRIHGLTTQFLSDKPLFEAVVENLLAYVQGAEIIIHNAPFDMGFLNAELQRCGKLPFKEYVSRVIDSLAMAKEMFPGKRNNLNALCDRLDVDNSGRTLHGALLDAELLADVYINMTRGQHALLMDTAEPQKQVGIQVQEIDLRSIELPVLPASADELLAHEQAMQDINKASGGKALWQ
ncbi:MAG: DNA polymerase III subunit epsilon [Rhodoferax sp.]|nr:DNA polymerase III subunit epsilon [Rhodoferax sp.]